MESPSMPSSVHSETRVSKRYLNQSCPISNARTCLPHPSLSLSICLCRISLLTDFEDGTSYLDWTIGVHGIWISFSHLSSLRDTTSSSETPSPLSSSLFLPRITSKQKYSATYLPEVIPDQGWDKVEAIDSAIRKAGWRGLITEDLRRSLKLRRYQSRKISVSWDDYVRWKNEELREA